MIRIVRRREAPEVLQTIGEQKTTENCDSYDRYRNDYHDRSKKFDFDSDVYGRESVKNTLLHAQYAKCCYCESNFRATSYGAVEHFRPKRAVKQDKGQRMEYPGYFWLAYKWSNLLVSCEVCNTTYKGNLFPLEDDTKRARSHRDNLGAERPLFIDPAGEDPRQHIRFRRAEVVDLTERGRVTIQGLGLGRNELEETRRERLAHLEALRWIAELEDGATVDEVERARTQLEEATLPNAKYSSMAQDFLDPGRGGDEDG